VSERGHIALLILVMALAVLLVSGVSGALLYRAASTQARQRLTRTAQSQALLAGAIARFDARHSAEYPGGWLEATLSQLRAAHDEFEGFGETGEFTLARREGDAIVFLLRHRHGDRETPRPVPLASDLAEPMRRALAGDSGTVVGLDYRGELVLAAYEPVPELACGLVAKIDMREVRSPFVAAGAMSIAVGLLAVSVGAVVFVRLSAPLVRRLEASESKFRSTFEQATVGLAHARGDGRFLEVNPTFCEITGYTREELLGLTFHDITHPEDVAADSEQVARLLAREVDTYALEKRYVQKDGAVVWVNLKATAVFDASGSLSYLMATVEDVTEFRTVQEELARHRDNLEQEVRDRTQELRTMVNAMAGREVRMAELKEEIRALRQQGDRE